VREAVPSLTAQRVAAYRLGFERQPAPFGDPAADLRLSQDVVGPGGADNDGPMARYLQARTTFFDRVLLNALERGTTQVVLVGAGYDGRALRYAKPRVDWFELDHPATQADKRERLGRLGLHAPHIHFVEADFNQGGVAEALLAGGYQPGLPSVLLCEGVAAGRFGLRYPSRHLLFCCCGRPRPRRPAAAFRRNRRRFG
jgi:methyltransferase (TIGR00027 family)